MSAAEPTEKSVYADPGNPVFAFMPSSKEFYVCLCSESGVLGYFRFRTPKHFFYQITPGGPKSDYLGHAELVEIYPADFSVPRSADVYKLSLSPRQAAS